MPIDNNVVSLIEKLNQKKNRLYSCKASNVCVGDIAKKNITIKAESLGREIINSFEENPSVYALPVVENNKVLGLIMKETFFAKMGTKYGFTLYLNRPISLIMNNHPLIVNYYTTIDAVSKMAMSRKSENLYDIIIVTKDNEYYGVVTVKDLLEKTTEIEINYAKHLNPLSGLPGNMLIEKKLTELLLRAEPFTVLYLDIDNFKAYNDVYGFENGDKMIQVMAEIMNNCAGEHPECENCFLGHIGGDDFVMCINGYAVENICKSILNEFEVKTAELYTPSDYKNGHVMVKNRKGDIEKTNNVTLSIACVTNKDKKLDDIYELSKVAAKVKKECKEIWANHYAIY
jgi:diguanylate cyclase (GGDEF)-like protein